MPRKRVTMKTNRKSFNLTSSCAVSLVSLCTAVLLSSSTVLASDGEMSYGPGSGGGTDGFALQEIGKEQSTLSMYEKFIKAFEESKNNKINLNWEVGTTLESGVVVSEVTRLISPWKSKKYDTVSLYYVKDSNLAHVTDLSVIYLRRTVIPNPIGTPEYETPQLTIGLHDDIPGLYYDSKDMINNVDVLTTRYSILTNRDSEGHLWEVRQFNPNTVIFVKYPDTNNTCGELSGTPQNGYCMVGVIFNNGK